jgi:hypothetical protein
MSQGTTLKTQITNYKAKLEGAIRKREQLEKEHFAIEREVDLLIKVVMNLESIKE